MAFADDLSALTASLDSWEIAGYVSAALVALSVAGELAHDFNLFKSVGWWREKGEKACGLILVAALVAEVVIQIQVSSISGRIIAILEYETAEARERTAKLERQEAWRRISPEQSKKVADAIRDIAPTISLRIEYQNGDREAFSYGRDLSEVFAAAGVDAQNIHWGARSWPNTPVFGLHLSTTSDGDRTAIASALNSAGIPFINGLDITVTKNLVYLFVASRPAPSGPDEAVRLK